MNTPTPDQPSTGPIQLSGRVIDWQNPNGVPGATSARAIGASGDAYAHAAAVHMVTVEGGIFGVVATAADVIAGLSRLRG